MCECDVPKSTDHYSGEPSIICVKSHRGGREVLTRPTGPEQAVECKQYSNFVVSMVQINMCRQYLHHYRTIVGTISSSDSKGKLYQDTQGARSSTTPIRVDTTLKVSRTSSMPVDLKVTRTEASFSHDHVLKDTLLFEIDSRDRILCDQNFRPKACYVHVIAHEGITKPESVPAIPTFQRL